MSKIKIVRTGIRKESNGTDVVETKLQEVPQQCKECKKEPRKHGSKRCEKCTNGYYMLKASEQRLKQKIEGQKNIKK